MILLLSGQEKNSEFMGLRRFLRLWSLWGVSGNVLPRTEYTPPFYWNLGKQNWKSKSCSWGPWTIAVSWQRESSYLKKRLTSFWENHSKERDLSLKKKKKNIKYASEIENQNSVGFMMEKNQPTTWETWVQSLGWEDPLEKGKATHSSILAWRIPWTVQTMELQRVGHFHDGKITWIWE